MERLESLRDRRADRLLGSFPRGDSAVLLLLEIVDDAATGLVITRRSGTLATDPGFLAFPGGRMEPGEDAEAAARREAHEELGIDPTTVTVYGRLDDGWNGAGFRIVPVVGTTPGPVVLHPEPGEVADAWTAPLAELGDPERHRRTSVDVDGREFLDDAIELTDPLGERRELYGPSADLALDLLAWLGGEDRRELARRQHERDHFAAHRWGGS